MLKVYAHQYVRLGRLIHEFGGRLYLATAEEDDPGTPLTERDLHALKQHLEQVSKVCGQLGLRIAKKGIDRAIGSPPKTHREYDQLISVVMDELEGQLFLFVPADRAAHYDSIPVILPFPTASAELARAGNCFALAEHTACVFHAMRAAEVALDAVRTNLGMPQRDINQRSWGHICNDIRDGIKAKGAAWQKQDQYNSIYATLVALKDAWRNQTMHVAAIYRESDARSILNNTEAFIRRLSDMMDEAGLPPA